MTLVENYKSIRCGHSIRVASLMWQSGTAGKTTSLHAVPLQLDAERHLGAEGEEGEG